MSSSNSICAVIAVLFLSVGLSAQNILNVPAQYPTIQAAYVAAANGDKILVAAGTFVGNVALGQKPIILEGAGPNLTTVQGVGGPVISGSSLPRNTIIRSLRVTGGSLGGIYLDSDVELYRPLNPLLPLSCFAAWEDPNTVPDAVVGATAGHPAILACLTEAIRRLTEPDTGDWHTGNGAWSTGPGVFTALLPSRDDVTLLPPESFYPYHYTERHRRHDDHRGPDTYGAHHWAGSWL